MKSLEKYFNKRKANTLLLLKKPKQSYRFNTFHDLRVEIKKLNALCELIEECVKKFKRKKTFEPFDIIFDQAGKVRELQIETRLLNKYFLSQMLKTYEQNLSRKRSVERTLYFSLINPKAIKELKQKYGKIESMLQKVSKKEARKFMDERLNKIESMIEPSTLKTTQLHDLRKKLKEYEYVRSGLDMDGQVKPIPNLTDLTDLLGEWHDGQVITIHINNALDNKTTTAKEKKQLQKIKDKIGTENKNLLSKIKEIKSDTKI
jgi:CHAD domain-containing protein